MFVILLLFFIYTMSCVTFMLFAWDKHLAVCLRRRVPEAVLILLSCLFGGFGALCAMVLFRHKTQKTAFLVCIPIVTSIQIAIPILIQTLVY